MRQSKAQNYMEIAEVASKRSHDAETQVGSVLVSNKNGAILGTGYNGFVRGVRDNQLPNTRPDKYAYMVHSETNLICNIAKNGVSTEDSTLYCTHSPCITCMRMIYQCGITKVIIKKKYSDFEKILEMKDIKVKESITEDGFIELTYESHES